MFTDTIMFNEILEDINHKYFNDSGRVHTGLRRQVIYDCSNDTEFIKMIQKLSEDLFGLFCYNDLLNCEGYLDINYNFNSLKIVIKIKEF